MPSIVEILNALNVNKNIKENLAQIESFYQKFKVNPIEDLFNEDEKELNNSIFDELKKTLESNVITAQNPSKEELEALQKELQKKRKDIGQLSFQGKEAILKSLNEIIEKLIGFAKQRQIVKGDEERKDAYLNAKKELQKADIEILKIKIKTTPNTKDIAELYKLINPPILGLARIFSLKKEIVNNNVKENLTICLNSIREKLKLPTDEAINFSHLVKIPNWSSFKLSLNKKFEQSKLKEKNITTSSANLGNFDATENLSVLRSENSRLTNELSELKEKITSLKAQLSAASSSANNDNAPGRSTIETFDSSKDQNDERITNLNNQLAHQIETNKTLTEELDTNKKLNINHQQAILNLNSELENLKSKLTDKEKQFTENLEKLKQHEEQITFQEKELLKNKETLESFTKKNEKLSKDLTASSKTLDEKKQLLIKTEGELNAFSIKSNQIELQKNELESKLEQTELYNAGILKQNEEAITKLNAELEESKEKLETVTNKLSTNSKENGHTISLFEADIEEKKSALERLSNELNVLKDKERQFKKDAADLRIQLETKSQHLNDNESRLKTLTEQFKDLSTTKIELKEKYQTQSTEYENLKAQHALNIRDLEKKLDKLQKKNTLTENEKIGLNETISTLTTSLQEEKSKFSASEQELAKLKNEFLTLQRKLVSMEEINFKLSQTQKEKEEISTELETITKEYASFVSKTTATLSNIPVVNSQMYLPLPASDTSIEKLDEILQKIDLLKKQAAQNKELQNQLDILKIELEEKDAKIFEIDLFNISLDNENIQKLTQEKEELENKITELLENIDSLKDQNKNLIDSLKNGPIQIEEDLETDFDQFGFSFDAVQKDNPFESGDEEDEIDYKSFSKTIQELSETKSKLEQSQAELQQNTDELIQLQAQLKSQEKEFKLEIDALTKDLSELQTKISELEKLKNNHEELQQKHSDLQKKYDTLEENLKVKTEEIKDLTNKIPETQQQLEISRPEVENLNKEIETIKNNAQSLEEKLQELQPKEDPIMPAQDTPHGELLIDLDNLNDDNKHLRGIDPIPPHSSSPSPTSSPLPPSYSNDFLSIFSPDRTSSTENIPHDSGFSDSTSPSSSNSSSLKRSQGLSDLTKFYYKQDNLAYHNDSLSNHLLNSGNRGIQEDEVPITTPINSATPMPILQQIDSLLSDQNFKESLKNALAARLKAEFTNELNKPENGNIVNSLCFPESELNKLKQLVDDTVARLFNEAIKKVIKTALTQVVSSFEEAEVLSAENTAIAFLDLFKLNTFVDVPEDYENCHDIIVETFDTNRTNAQEYVALLKLCEEEILNTEAKNVASDDIIADLNNRLIAINVDTGKYNNQVKHIASQLVDKILNPTNVFEALEVAKLSNSNPLSLIDDIKQILDKQYDKEIQNIIETNFADIYIDHILEKIKAGTSLSEDEIQMIPSALQYTNSVYEFVAGLRVEYPKLSSNYENKINDETFKKVRLILRKNALSTTKNILPDNDISDLTSEMWLEKQLQLITGKSIKLEDIKLEEEQKNLLNELDSALHLSTFYDIALTPKSITELKADLEKLSHAQLTAAGQANKLFAEIENRQKDYLEINHDPVPGFLQKIEEETNPEILHFNEEGTKILFSAIGKHLLKIGKWDYFNAKVFNYKVKDITQELLTTIPSNDYEKDSIEKTIEIAIGFLSEKNSKDKLHKEQILKDIAFFYASTEKLSIFNAEIANRKVKIKNLSELKVKKDEEVQTTTGNSSAAYAGIFLPHNCTIIANSLDPNLKITANFEFKILADTFYASNAMEVGQTITFESKLSGSSGSKEWSVTRDATGSSYSVRGSWTDKLKNIGGRIRNKIDPFTSSQLSAEDKEVIFAAFQHAKASNKAPVQTLIFGANCPELIKTYMYSLIENFNQEQRKNGQKSTILIDGKDERKTRKNAETIMNNEIDIKNSPSKEPEKAVKRSGEALNQHTTTLRKKG